MLPKVDNPSKAKRRWRGALADEVRAGANILWAGAQGGEADETGEGGVMPAGA